MNAPRISLVAVLLAGTVFSSTIASAFWIPNDSDWLNQTDITRIGVDQAWDSVADASGDLPDSTGSDSVLVAVIDRGFLHHPDLENMWFKNEKDDVDAPPPQVDDDQNGYISDFTGWDVADNDNDPFVSINDCDFNTVEPHGIYVAGLIAAEIHNGNAGPGAPIKSIAGVAQVKILPIRYKAHGGGCAVGTGTDQDLDLQMSAALDYAIEMDADIITMAIGYPNPNNWAARLPLTTADLQRAHDGGALLIASAGTENNCNEIMYPASSPYVIAVTGSRDSGAPSAGSCHGPQAGIAGPFEFVETLEASGRPNWQYSTTGLWSGTSLACAIVSGVAALILSYRSDLTNDQVRQILYASADGDGVRSNQLGWGIVNAAAAASMALTTRESATGGFAFGSTMPAYIGPSAQPATDIDGFGNTHVVYIGDAIGNANHEVIYLVIDAAGHVAWGPVRVEANAGTVSDPSDSPDIFVDWWGNAYIGWIERTAAAMDGEIYYVEYAADHTVATAITHEWTQLAPNFAGRVENLNIMVSSGGILFVYDQDLTATIYGAREIVLKNVAQLGATWVIGTGRDPTADIGPDSTSQVQTTCPTSVCVYYAYVSGDAQASFVWWGVVDSVGNEVVAVQNVQGSAGTYLFSAPSLDLDPYTIRSALAWSRFDMQGADILNLQTRSITFAWIDWDGTMASAYPKTLGLLGGGGKDPSVSTNGKGGAGVAWTGKRSDDTGPNVVYVEVSKTGVESTWSPSISETQIGVGAGPGTPTSDDPLYPQVAASKPLFDWDFETYDRADGNYRFVWLQLSQQQILPHYSSTKPAFTTPWQGAWGDSDFPDLALGTDGSTHIVYQVNAGLPGVSVWYAYWPSGQSPSGGPPIGPGAFDIKVCCAQGLADSPKVEFTWESVPIGSLVVTKLYVHVFFIRNDPPAPVIWVAKYESGNPNVMGGYPTQFGADGLVFQGAIADTITDLDTTAFIDHESDVSGMGSYSNPVNTPNPLKYEPVLSAVWVEHYANPAFDRLQFGSTDRNNGVVQDEVQVTMGFALSSPSLANGPGDRYYVGYLDFNWAYLTALRMQSRQPAITTVCDNLWLNPNAVPPLGDARRIVIATDQEFDRVDPAASSSSGVDFSDNQIHVVMGTQASPVGPGASYFDMVYTRVRDVGNKACNAPGAPYLKTTVELRTIVPADSNGDGFLSESEPVGMSIAIGPDSRPVIAYAAAKDKSIDHSCGNCVSEIYMIGLTNGGVPGTYSETMVSGVLPGEKGEPSLALDSAGMPRLAFVGDLGLNPAGQRVSYMGWVEAPRVPY